jgi:enolase
MSIIKALKALEILDSRGRPTVQVTCCLESGVCATVSVPSGASTGQAEALELRDGDPKRFGGLGCLKAVSHVNTIIQDALKGQLYEHQSDLDRALLELDPTPHKSKLGANAILGVSLAFARAQAKEKKIPLYQHFAEMLDLKLEYLPGLTINLFSGGKHAGGQVAIQDVLLVPRSAPSIQASLVDVYAVMQSAIKLLATKYAMRPLKADEGGLAPAFANEEAMIQDAVHAIEASGLRPGLDMALAVDVASSHFYQNQHYHVGKDALSSEQMIAKLGHWLDQYPILSLEDGLAEEDWASWAMLTKTLGEKCLILGDDLLCTNAKRIEKAAHTKAANSLLLKVNQIGTVTEAAQALSLARNNHWQVVVSARSGETEDDWLADLATGWQADFIKVGSIQQSERLAKYNRLLAIEAETSLALRSIR